MERVTSDIAYDYIRRRILNREFPMGHPLHTNTLATAIGVSRTPVRDALRRLEADGLVDIQPHFGARVRTLDINEFGELCIMRLALESTLAGMAAETRSDADLREISFALGKMNEITAGIRDEASEASLHPELVREDVRFHIAIMTAARKDMVKREVLRLHLLNRVVSGAPRSSTANSQTGLEKYSLRNEHRRLALASHQAIYDAILRRDKAAAHDAMRRHIQNIIDFNLQRIAKDQAPATARPLTEEEEIYLGS